MLVLKVETFSALLKERESLTRCHLAYLFHEHLICCKTEAKSRIERERNYVKFFRKIRILLFLPLSQLTMIINAQNTTILKTYSENETQERHPRFTRSHPPRKGAVIVHHQFQGLEIPEVTGKFTIHKKMLWSILQQRKFCNRFIVFLQSRVLPRKEGV